MAMWLGQHTKTLKIVTCGFVSTTHNPLRVAENIATMDHMLGGRFGVGIVRGYQSRWVENFKIRPDLAAVGPWNKNSDEDNYNRAFFEEFVDVVVTALKSETFHYDGEHFQIPPKGLVNPHPHTVYTDFGKGVGQDMAINEVGIAPRPLQQPHPPLYGGFTHSLNSAKFWARYLGRPIVLAGDLDFCQVLWRAYAEEAAEHGHNDLSGNHPCWGGLMICAETDAEAQAQMEDVNWFWNSWPMQFGQGMPSLLVGSPDTISRQIEAAAEAVDIDETFLLIPQGIHTESQINKSLELFGEKVIPRFKG
jgi:alkanesulfonate monooxygenase SsuD/methylene tetrahydromethanopterin reductase-like flavin-dependent oxidoreductase (luciferase family)